MAEFFPEDRDGGDLAPDGRVIRILAQDFREELAKWLGVFHFEFAGLFHVDSVLTKIREQAASRTSATGAYWKPPNDLIEMFFRMIAPHPFFKHLQVRGIVRNAGDRNLMRALGAFDLMAIDLGRAGPALRRAQYNHGPARAFGYARAFRTEPPLATGLAL
jgi:hypothetical protein